MKVTAEGLRNYCEKILKKNDVPDIEAEVIADSLVDANTLGIDSHGVTRLPLYLERLEKGSLAVSTEMEIVKDYGAITVFDANNGWGQYAGKIAMEHAVEKAKQYGISAVGVNNSNHFGTASYFTKLAAKEDCIGIALCNTLPIMVPWGSMEPTLGTNPISIAVPTNSHPSVLDMATSTVARGKINLAAKNEEEIPLGWAITEDGKETTDPHEALKGYLLPLGPKGSGLAMMVDILSGVLTGSLFGKDIPRMYDDDEPQNIGHFFIAINIESFMDLAEFKERMDHRIEQTRNSKPQEGFQQVYMPGDIEQLKQEQRQKEGITLSQAVYDDLLNLGKKYGVPEEILISG